MARAQVVSSYPLHSYGLNSLTISRIEPFLYRVVSISSTKPMVPVFLTGMSSLTRLGISLRRLFGDLPIDFTHMLYTNITHLEIFDHEAAQIPEGLSLIPNLTHCAFNYKACLDPTQHILQTCPKLQYLSFVVSLKELEDLHDQIERCAVLADDLRFVVAIRPRFHEDWLLGAQLQDFWARAEAFVGLKRGRESRS
jgi:hypothetical protein